jgi:adenylyltransferase/sulfurtransferase
MPLSFDEEARYSRHLILPGVGLGGQERLRRARVLVVGAGGLGSPVALYLAAAGVGTLGIADGDVVDVSNLQRQVLHRTDGVGTPKASSAQAALAALNPLVRVEPLTARITAANARERLADYDVVVDCTDNFPTRYLLNDACALLGKPLVFGSIYRFEGQVSVFDARRGPCYRCLFPEPPDPARVPSCAEGGVLGVLPGMVGTMQATETLKLLLDLGEPLIGRLLLLDALTLRVRELALAKNPDCPLCGEAPTIRELVDYDAFCGIAPADPAWEIAPDEIATLPHPVLLDVRDAWEHDETPPLPGALTIPYPQLARRLHELDTADDLVVYCSRGLRSQAAVALLHRAGFARARSLRGGLAGR